MRAFMAGLLLGIPLGAVAYALYLFCLIRCARAGLPDAGRESVASPATGTEPRPHSRTGVSDGEHTTTYTYGRMPWASLN